MADCHTYFVGRGEWGFSVWVHNYDVTLNDSRTTLKSSFRDERMQALKAAYAQGGGDPNNVPSGLTRAWTKQISQEWKGQAGKPGEEAVALSRLQQAKDAASNRVLDDFANGNTRVTKDIDLVSQSPVWEDGTHILRTQYVRGAKRSTRNNLNEVVTMQTCLIGRRTLRATHELIRTPSRSRSSA